jgi:hypothetical protein
MGIGLTSRISVSRDTLIHDLFERDFFERVPDLDYLKPKFEACRQVYKDELGKKGCTCRMNSNWAKPCLTETLDAVEAAKKTNHELVRKFIRFISHRDPNTAVDHMGVGIIYDRHYDIFVEQPAEAT